MMVCRSSLAKGLLGLVLTIGAGQARATDWHELLAHPVHFVGTPVQLSQAFCGGGGPQGAEPDVTQCSIAKGDVYVESRVVAPTPRGQVMHRDCGGLDVWEHSPFCRFTVKFVMRSFRISNEIDLKKPVLLIETDRLEID